MTWDTDRGAPILAVLLAGLILASCAALERQRVDSASFDLSYGFYTLDPRSFRMVPVRADIPDSRLVLVFPLVPGSITGPPSGPPVQTVAVQPGGRFELRLPAEVASRASPVAAASLTIEPADTRLARLGSFHEYPEYGPFRGGGGFIDTGSGDSLLLVYFSNPARLSGIVHDATGAFEYDVTVERAGWSWLVVRGQGNDSFLVQTYTGSTNAIEFGVLLPPAMIQGT